MQPPKPPTPSPTRRKVLLAAILTIAARPWNGNPYMAAASQGAMTQNGLAQVNWSDLKQLTIQLPKGVINLSADEVWAALGGK